MSASSSLPAADTPQNPEPGFSYHEAGGELRLVFAGRWCLDQHCPLGAALIEALPETRRLVLALAEGCEWDSQLLSRLLPLARHCEQRGIEFVSSELPSGAQQLLGLATAVAPNQHTECTGGLGFVGRLWKLCAQEVVDFTAFVGEIAIASSRLVKGQANTRWRDFFAFVQQAGPDALPLVTLVSLLVGMILAFLGLVQLRFFGAEIYVANLVSLGMVREMGALMASVIIAGRTGASYAAQLGTMQVNEEVDAVTTLGMSPMEFLVLPRFYALVAMMPLICLFANVMGLIGGTLVATAGDITVGQYLAQSREAVGLWDILTGLIKSFIFAMLIAIAGCKAGIQSGRNSAAVGEATTKAVVTAIIYLVIADAGLNILYDRLGI